MKAILIILALVALVTLFYFKLMPKTAMKGLESGFGSKTIEELEEVK